MFTKIKNLIKYLTVEFKDIRMVGFAVFGVIAILVSWSGVSVIQTNYELEKQVSSLQQQIDVDKLANTNLKLRNEYYNTDDYLELAARRQFGKAAPGETLVIVPKSVAYKYAPDLTSATKKTKPKQLEKPLYQKNFEAWMNFFRHRNIVD